MASLQASRFMLTTSCSSCTRTRSAVSLPKLPKFNVSIQQIPIKNRNFRVEEPSFRLDGFAEDFDLSLLEKQRQKKRGCDDQVLQRSRLMAVLEEVIDRVEMHKNSGEQRNNWNSLLLNSVNMITLTAALMAGIASMNASGVDSVSAVNIASTVLLASATGLAALMNKIQPSQLVEEQRNATRLFKQLRNKIEMVLREKSEDGISEADVKEAIKRVLCLDKAYPLPLVGTMLEKFPQEFKPATWWPETKPESTHSRTEANGWNSELEVEMREVVEVIKSRDAEEYDKLGNVALKLNRVLAISGPVLTGIAAVSSGFIGHGSGLAGVVATTCASLAAVVNTLEHGGQVGMVFEMYRNSAGFFSLLEDTIKTERRENGQVFETKVALKLGRSLSELKDLARRSSLSRLQGSAIDECASKLF
ncbi:Petal formation-expressed [Arabidopsis thaliana x Arabidopsis arenosa]|uniref:Petal formation-expressed n=1 Tax=Arabidopsis thaliana x Arabidopsis arenosa TaxID=1240361 RepID=A0A8T1YAK2_9BRAS|nr:Petal formation-expressed [Arabidopsis thaliana x Arabidopsis arenosa]